MDGQPQDVPLTDGLLRVEHLNSASRFAKQINFQATARAVVGIAVPAGTSVNAVTVNDVQGAPPTFVVKTVSGEITLRRPAGVGADVTATNSPGSVVVGEEHFSSPGQTPRATAGPQKPRVLVRTSTVSGNVSIMHAAPEPGNPTLAKGDL